MTLTQDVPPPNLIQASQLPTWVGNLPQAGDVSKIGAYVTLSSEQLVSGIMADSETAMLHREAQIGRLYGIYHRYASPWSYTYARPAAVDFVACERGRTLMLSMSIDTPANIVAGTDDATLTELAHAWASFPFPIIMRIGWEMNIASGFAWSQVTAATFIQAWQRIVGIFRNAGATNVSWFWCPNAASDYSWQQYYPGDGYVDYQGCDGYNATPNWVWAETVYDTLLSDLNSGMGGRSAGKPLLIGEWGTPSTPGNRPFWLYDTAAYFKSKGVAGHCYFDKGGTSSGLSDAASQTAFGAIAADPELGGLSHVGKTYVTVANGDSPITAVTFGNANNPRIVDTGFQAGGVTVVGTIRYGVSPAKPGLGSCGVIFRGQGDSGGGAPAVTGHVALGTLGNSGASISTTGLSVEFLFMDDPTDTNLNSKVFGVAQSANSQRLVFIKNSVSAGTYELLWHSGATLARNLQWTGVINDGNWHHIVWVISPTGTDLLYIDGVAQSPTVANSGSGNTWYNWNEALYLGAENYQGTTSSPTTCGLDQFRIYAAQLTTTQIGNHYAALTSGVTLVRHGGITEGYGSGAPTHAGAVGDVYNRSDTPTVANQRRYICTVAGGTAWSTSPATWVGIL